MSTCGRLLRAWVKPKCHLLQRYQGGAIDKAGMGKIPTVLCQSEAQMVGKTVPEIPRVERITSLGNPYVKHCVKLRTSRRYRQKVGRLILSGTQVLREVFGELD